MSISATKASQIRQAIIDNSGPLVNAQIGCANHLIMYMLEKTEAAAKAEGINMEEVRPETTTQLIEIVCLTLGILVGSSLDVSDPLSSKAAQKTSTVMEEIIPLIEISIQAALLKRSIQPISYAHEA